MKLYASYVAEAKARQRRRVIGGVVCASLLASLLVWITLSVGMSTGAKRSAGPVPSMPESSTRA